MRLRDLPNQATRPGGLYQLLDISSLAVPYFFERKDGMSEMNWPDGPDPFQYREHESAEQVPPCIGEVAPMPLTPAECQTFITAVHRGREAISRPGLDRAASNYRQ